MGGFDHFASTFPAPHVPLHRAVVVVAAAAAASWRETSAGDFEILAGLSVPRPRIYSAKMLSCFFLCLFFRAKRSSSRACRSVVRTTPVYCCNCAVQKMA